MVSAKLPDPSSQASPLAGGLASAAELPSAAAPSPGHNGYTYVPGGRRDPFGVVLPSGKDTKEDLRNLPPLQRVSLSELNLIGIIWGGFGYTAMVQTSDGKGYTVRPGTRLGSNNGVVDSITTSAIIVHEHLTDVYGNRQVREIVMRLHPKESQE
jgi:type IV pilus assembly protein PilP